MDPKLTTLNGGLTLTVTYEPRSESAEPISEAVKVRQIPVREYDAGFACIEDEPALVGFLAAKNRSWALTLNPDSYETVLTTGRKVNARGFFTYCERRTEQAERRNAATIGMMSNLPPETLKLAIEIGKKSISQPLSPSLAPSAAR